MLKACKQAGSVPKSLIAPSWKENRSGGLLGRQEVQV